MNIKIEEVCLRNKQILKWLQKSFHFFEWPFQFFFSDGDSEAVIICIYLYM